MVDNAGMAVRLMIATALRLRTAIQCVNPILATFLLTTGYHLREIIMDLLIEADDRTLHQETLRVAQGLEVQTGVTQLNLDVEGRTLMIEAEMTTDEIPTAAPEEWMTQAPRDTNAIATETTGSFTATANHIQQ